MKRQISIIILLAAIVLCSCSDKLPGEGLRTLAEGEQAECRLGLSVGDFQVVSGSSTRATDAEATDAEKKVENIWVFQYDGEGNLILNPKYYESSNCKNDDGSWNVVLYVKESAVYVVANTNDSTWASDASDFATLAALKAKSIPSPYPIQVGSGDGFVEADKVTIPMMGSKELTTNDFASSIKVDVERMYAKLIIQAKMLNDIDMAGMEVNNIPYTCRIEPRAADNDPNQTDAATYSSVEFITRSYNTSNDATTSTVSGKEKESNTYVIYVPENIQGVNPNYLPDGGTQKGRDYGFDDGCPANALAINYRLSIKKDNSDSRVQGSAMVFPGANNTNNFNVNRNYVYKVTANFSDKSYFFPTPSSNCFVVVPGETITFWPYYRTEKGGNYDFKKYLDPTDPQKTIKGVKIIWQDKDVIGDNSNGDLVRISSSGQNYTSYEDIIKEFTIDVKTNKVGNALIGAYNNEGCTGDVLWSWHIWVTDKNPDNVGNAIRYTTYEWDNNGIYADKPRVPGYQVMPCNLGAKALVNSSSSDRNAVGLLYQWGRKDPFPPMTKGGGKTKYTNDNAGIHYGNANEVVYKTSDDNDQYLFYTHLGKELSDAIGYSVAHPTVFIAGTFDLSLSTNEGGSGTTGNYDYYFNIGDWCPQGQSDNELWGGREPDSGSEKHIVVNNVEIYDNYGSEKTIFDPCPSGWRVPPGDLWLGFTSTGKNPASLSEINCKYVDGKQNYNAGMYMYLEGWKTGTPSYFPTPGARVGDGMGIRSTTCGNYHNASTGKDNKLNILHLHPDAATLFNIFENQFVMYHVKSCACSIRCVRDKK